MSTLTVVAKVTAETNVYKTVKAELLKINLMSYGGYCESIY